MSWIPLAFTTEIRLEQHFRATGNVRSDSDNVSVWEVVDKIDLLVDGASAFSSFIMRSTISGGHVERLKPGLRHALSVCLGIQKRIRG